MQTGDIIVSTNKGNPFSSFIRWFTNSRWSHVRLVLGNDSFVEATWPKVRTGHVGDIKTPYAVLRPANPLTEQEARTLFLYAAGMLGKRYDWRGCISFIIHKNVQKKSWFFCSELVAQSYENLGRPLLRREACWTTPQDIYGSLAVNVVEEK